MLANSSKALVLYTDFKHLLATLSKDKQADLIMFLFDYVDSGTTPEGIDTHTAGIFQYIKNRLDTNTEKRQKLAENGKKGGLAKSSNGKQKVANSSKVYLNKNKSINIYTPLNPPKGKSRIGELAKNNIAATKKFLGSGKNA